ncbi:Multiple myeloma tumor-associated protein 2 [Ceratobasidium theobromae]|uniref:Multiple myeloma tumor-associated protein 2 n=1 Tax=Ceratobasidium theobromae TaxID=1582974 RepID=A0A5N5QDP3_9AGAM|nr:Multiple myeloma tumor-associated protein 2 [Ceratobasidium theobromae]
MYEPTRGGTRGGQAEFKWSDVSADKDREHYLGHSINAPTGRWQKNKDVHWYNRDIQATAEEKAEEIRKIKEAEAEAMAIALGFKPTLKPGTSTAAGPATGANATPATGANSTTPAMEAKPEHGLPHDPSDKEKLIEREIEKSRKALEKQEKRERKEQRRAEKEMKRAARREQKHMDRGRTRSREKEGRNRSEERWDRSRERRDRSRDGSTDRDRHRHRGRDTNHRDSCRRSASPPRHSRETRHRSPAERSRSAERLRRRDEDDRHHRR